MIGTGNIEIYIQLFGNESDLQDLDSKSSESSSGKKDKSDNACHACFLLSQLTSF